MANDSRNAEEVNLVTTPQENQTPTINERQEQPEAPAWATGIQQALEKLIKVIAQNVAPGKNQQNEPSQSQIQREPEPER